MKVYEGLFIYPPDQGPEAQKASIKNLDDLIAKFKGTITDRQDWGKKPLGYSLRKSREGQLLVLTFQMDPLSINELRKVLELQEDILKYTITVKNPKSEKKPAAKPEGESRSVRPSSSATVSSH